MYDYIQKRNTNSYILKTLQFSSASLCILLAPEYLEKKTSKIPCIVFSLSGLINGIRGNKKKVTRVLSQNYLPESIYNSFDQNHFAYSLIFIIVFVFVYST